LKNAGYLDCVTDGTEVYFKPDIIILVIRILPPDSEPGGKAIRTLNPEP